MKHNTEIKNELVSWFCSSSMMFQVKVVQKWLRDPIQSLTGSCCSDMICTWVKILEFNFFFLFFFNGFFFFFFKNQAWNHRIGGFCTRITFLALLAKGFETRVELSVSSREIRVKVVHKRLPDPMEFLSGSPGSDICWLRIKILTSSCWFAKNIH